MVDKLQSREQMLAGLGTRATGEPVERPAWQEALDAQEAECRQLRAALIAIGRMIHGVRLADDVSSGFLAALPEEMAHYHLSTPTEEARERIKVLEEARPFSEWHEDLGDVLWWKLPLAGAPYCGSPLDLGRGMKVTVQIGFEEHEMPIAHTGGWPFTEEDEPDLWWTPLPSPTFSHTALGNQETDRHG